MNLAETYVSLNRPLVDEAFSNAARVVKDFVKLAPSFGSEILKVKNGEPIAIVLAKALKILQEIDIDASKHDLLKTARIFRRVFKPESLESSRYLHRAVKYEFSTLLNVPYWKTKLPANRGFLNWATKIRLDGHLGPFNHKVMTNEEGSIFFQTPHKRIAWSDVRDIALKSLEKAKGLHPFQVRFYEYLNGPTFIDTFDLSSIHPVRQITPPGQSYFEICVHAPELGITRNHTWWNYVMGETGLVYSFTVYRDESLGMGAIKIMHESQQCIDLTVPNYPYISIKFAMHSGQLQMMLDYEKSLHGKILPFNNINHNCTTAAVHRLAMLNITNIPNFKKNAWLAYGPKKVVNLCLTIEKMMPRNIAALCFAIINLIGVLIVWYHSGTVKDKIFKDGDNDPVTGKPIKPLLSLPGSLFDPNAIDFTSPWFFKEIVIGEATRWRAARKEELSRLNADPAEIARVDYEVPPEWYGTAARRA